MKQKGSLSFTLAVAFFTLSLASLLISGILQIVSYSQTQQDSITGKLQLIANDAATSVSGFIQEKLNIMESVAKMSKISTMDPEKLNLTLINFISLQPSFRSILVLDSGGNIITNASRISQKLSSDFVRLVKKELYPQIKNTEKYISTVYFDQTSNEPLIVLAIHERNALKDIQGTVVVEVNLKFMWDLMGKINVGKTGYAYVVNRKGDLIAFRDSSRVLKGESLSKIKIIGYFIKNNDAAVKNKSVAYRGINGSQVVGTYIPLGTPDWAVVTELPAGEAYSEIVQNLVVTFIIILIIAVIAGIIGIVVARRLAVPLISLTATANRISKGEMDLKASLQGPQEVISLASAFNSMTEKLRIKMEEVMKNNNLLKEVIESVKNITVNLNSSSKEIEAAAQEQTSASNEHASGVTQVSATLEELTITAKQITTNVGDLVVASGEAIKMLKEGEKELLQTVLQLDEVGKISSNNTTQIGELGKRSNIINEMVEIIKEVANKTNMLSINASIEASRAGEAGKGFSVVAAEIRELSKETITSAKNVEKAAKEIQDFLNSIIISSESESEKVLTSGKTVKHIKEKIENVTGSINNNYTFTQKIDVSIKQQENGSKQATETMRQMAEIARQSAETARQTMLAVKDIVNFSMELDSVIQLLNKEK